MRAVRSLIFLALLIGLPLAPARAQSPERFSSNEILDAGHRMFGGVSRGLASVVEKAFSTWGQPNGYILGEEGSGAFVAGLRYGEGTLYTKNAGDLRVYWQGPSVGVDWGGWAMKNPGEHAALEAELFALADQDVLRPVEPSVLPLEDAGRVLTDIAARRIVGKVVLAP